MFRLASMIDVDEGFYQVPTLSTAGAVSIKDEKGRLVTKKVKVHRYVAGKRPDYAGNSEGEYEEDYENISADAAQQPDDIVIEQPLNDDRRLRRLLYRNTDEENDERLKRHCERMENDNLDEIDVKHADNDDEMSDEEISRRREALKQRLIRDIEEPEWLQREGDDFPEEEKDEYTSEEEVDSDEENEEEMTKFGGRGMPRLKPVFVKRRDRGTIVEKDVEVARLEKEEIQAQRKADEQRRQTLRMLEDEIRRERQDQKNLEQAQMGCLIGNTDLNTDDEENDNIEYEKWKLRELKRLKRDRDQREEKEKERIEAERNRLLADTGRMDELNNMQRVVVNKEIKGKYKFLQKYFHRGAFYLDKDDGVFKRDFSAPTLEDHFDKTILPKVMQVKNFGMAGRTKYTHLVDQDTTCFESPFAVDKVQLLRFHNARGGGMKQCFEKPSLNKRKG